MVKGNIIHVVTKPIADTNGYATSPSFNVIRYKIYPKRYTSVGASNFQNKYNGPEPPIIPEKPVIKKVVTVGKIMGKEI